jgi:S-methylmethionine-dependent homocysteine/selenocysteine methylase
MIRSRLAAKNPPDATPPMLLLDGAMGTILKERGACVDGPAFSARAVLERPHLVREIHAAYAEAGATVHTAATFRATAAALAEHARLLGGAPLEARVVVADAVRLAREAILPGHRVAGSLASVVDCYRPGDLAEDPRAAHRAHAKNLADAGADLVLCETFADADEAVVAAEEAKATGLPVWVSLTAGPDAVLMTPLGMRAAAERLERVGVEAVLVGCTRAVATARFVGALAGLGVRVGAYGNAGRPEDGVGFVADWTAGSEPVSEAERADQARKYAECAGSWVDLGASIVGGCCGTTPEHIRALADAVVARWGGVF